MIPGWCCCSVSGRAGLWEAEECAPGCTEADAAAGCCLYSQRVLTRSDAGGACLGAPGMPELFSAHGAVGWGDSTGMCGLNWYMGLGLRICPALPSCCFGVEGIFSEWFDALDISVRLLGLSC